MEKLLFLAGLSPLVIFCLILMLKKKKFLYTTLTLAATAGIGAAACVLPINVGPSQQISKEKFQYLIEHNLDSGDVEQAAQYMERMYMEYGDTQELLTSQLRLAVVKEDMNTAILAAKEIGQYPNKEQMKLTEAEEQYIADVLEGKAMPAAQCELNKAIYEALVQNVEKPEDYGCVKVTEEEVKAAQNYEKELYKEIKDVIEENLEKAKEDKQFQKFIEALKVSDKMEELMTDEVWTQSEEDRKEVRRKLKRYVEDLTELYKEDPEVLELPEMKEAYINGCVWSEEYEPLVEYADKSADKDALASVAYLYMNDALEDSFLESFGSETDCDDVIEKCEEIYEKLEDADYSNAEMMVYEDYLDAVVSRNDDKVLANIEERMADTLEVTIADAGDYIQNAAINSELSDRGRVYENLNNAIEIREECEDDTLGEALCRINDIADKATDNQEIMHFNDYMVESYERSLPIKMDTVNVPEEFLNMGNTYVNEKRSMINVGNIVLDDFPELKAYVSTSGIDLTKTDAIEISDCGIPIEDFQIEKVEYDGAQVVLVCDNSGSMSGDIELLKSAVKKFVETRSSDEEIGIVTFSGDVLQNTGLTSDEDVLLSAVEAFHAGGGTNIASGVNAAFGEYAAGEDSLNVMIVMTDGQDNTYGSQSSIDQLRAQCMNGNIVLHTIGLGDVSVDYLQRIADSGMGSFVYSSSSAQLEDLYSFVHNQVDNNYLVTFTAKDVDTQEGRILTIREKDGDYSASREYGLNDGELKEEFTPGFGEISEETCVTKLGISTIIKSKDTDKTYEFTIIGKGLDKAEDISVSLKGRRQYVGLETTVSSPQKLTVKLPKDVEYDTYEVQVNIDGTPYTLKSLYVMKEGTMQEVVFGDYIFKAYAITEGDGTINLRGNVVMNDYLCFNGDIVLSGSLDGTVLVLEDEDGSYISGKGILPGLLAQFFDNKIELPRMDGLSLYKESDKYDKFYTRGKSYYGPLKINDPYIEVAPNYLNYTFVDFSFDFPVLNNILETDEFEDAYGDAFESPFSVSEMENKVVLAKEKIGIVLKVGADLDFEKELKLGKAELELSSFELEVDTFNHNYGLGLSVELEDVPILGNDESEYGFSIGIKSGRFDSFDLGADFDVDAVTLPNGITIVTLSDFHAGVEGMAGESQDANFGTRLLGSTFYGQTDVNFVKLNQLIPGLDTFLGDVLDITVLKMDDTKLGLTIANFNISLDTTAVLLECVELGKLEADLGNYSYENYLLGIDSQNVAGVHLKTSMDHTLDFGNNFNINVDGSTQVDVNKLFAGAMMNGDLSYNIKIFRRHTQDLEGNCLIGIHNSGKQFTVLIKGDDHKKNKEVGIRVSFTKGNFLPEVKLY